MRRIVISDESVNRYGFWVKTDGIDMTSFLKNPIMLWNHNRDCDGTVLAQLPIGRWKDLRVENGVLSGEPVFDEVDEFAQKIARKYESGTLNACSIGFDPKEWSEDPTLIKQGQKVATVVRCELLEISICDIPSNKNAVADVVLYNDNKQIINLSDIPGTVIGHKIKNMQEIALKLGLGKDASQQACVEAINAKDAEITTLKAEREALQAKLSDIEKSVAEEKKQEVTKLLDAAVKDGRIEATAKAEFEKLFAADHESAKKVLGSLPAREALKTTESGSEGSELSKLSWDELDRTERLAELKAKYPEVYTQKFNEKFNQK